MTRVTTGNGNEYAEKGCDYGEGTRNEGGGVEIPAVPVDVDHRAKVKNLSTTKKERRSCRPLKNATARSGRKPKRRDTTIKITHIDGRGKPWYQGHPGPSMATLQRLGVPWKKND